MSLGAFLGLPYQAPRGCARLVAAYLAERGIPYPDVDDPAQAPGWYRVDRPRADDVVVFNILGRPGHVGVCLGRDRFLHVEEGHCSGVDRLSSPMWSKRIEGYYRWAR